MIDINERRDRAATFGSDYLTDEEWVSVIDRLEAAEKDVTLKERVIDALGSELNAVANERDALRAKIAEMERQEPVMWVNSSNINSSRINKERGERGDQHTCSETQTTYHDTRLYALPGAQSGATDEAHNE